MSDAWKCWAENIQQDPSNVRCADNSGIYGLDGNPWYQSDNLNITPKEVKDGLFILDQQKADNPLVLCDTKYHVIRIFDDYLIGKQNKKGVTFAKGKQCVIIGLYNDHGSITPGNNCKQVCSVKDKLMEHGY